MTLQNQLKPLNACTEAVKWVGNKQIKTAWAKCERADWMLWLAARLGIDRKLLVLAACDCAETALKYVPEGEDRPAQAIQTARDWCEGKATLEQVKIAARAANTSRTTAAHAAHAASDATYVAANAVYTPHAAAHAAAYATDAATYATDAVTYAALATLVRKRIPVGVIEQGLAQLEQEK